MPPPLLKTLAAGFNSLTEHIFLILFPIGLDLFIWFGPRFRIMGLINRMVEDFNSQSQLLGLDSETAAVLNIGQDWWTLVGERFNLIFFLRSYPVGIPSLLAPISLANNPLGTPEQVQINSILSLIGVVIFFTLIGLVLGSLYYIFVAQSAVSNQVHWRRGMMDWLWSSFQVFILMLIFLVLFLAISIPASCAISAVSLSNLAYGQYGIMIYGVLLLWIIFPLLFSAHGIFVNQKKVWKSIKQGMLITRLTLPTTTFFFLTILVLSQVFDYLWRVPPENSWLMLIGLAGHAFVSTGFLSASFVYYRDADRWVMSLKNQRTPKSLPLKDDNQL